MYMYIYLQGTTTRRVPHISKTAYSQIRDSGGGGGLGA